MHIVWVFPGKDKDHRPFPAFETGVYDLIKRMMSLILIASRTASVPQCALAVTAGDALFGGAAAPVVTPEPVSEVTDDGDMYGGSTATAADYIELKVGDADSADGIAYIVYLQNRLHELGYLSDSADGVYGSGTEAAVAAFQKTNGLAITGIADVATQQKLFSDITALATPAPEDMSYGSEETKLLQKKLCQWGFLTGKADGVMGSGTSKAITEFKKYMRYYEPEYGTTPTPAPTPEPAEGEMPIVLDMPLVTPVPEEIATSGEIDHYVMEYVNGEKEFVFYRADVRPGDKSADALRVQKRLRQLDYLYSPDGEFGANSERALKYFQRKHGLAETGVADRITQEILFSTDAIEAEEYVFPYRIGVDLSEQKVYIMAWTGEDYSELVGTMLCSTGLDSSPTPTGTYQAHGRTGGENNGEWYYFEEFECYAKWAYRIVGGIMFHSVVFNENKKLRQSTVEKLGQKASHGCIRLEIDHAKWIYDNCPVGTTVEIRE